MISGDLMICFGVSIVLIVEFGFVIYIWSVFGSINEVMVNSFGLVGVMVMDVEGCFGEVIVLVEEVFNLMLMILGDFIFCEDEVSILSLD